MDYLEKKQLPTDEQSAMKVLKMDRRGFLMADGILYYEGDTQCGCCLVVPSHLQQKILDEQHDGLLLVTLLTRGCAEG